MGPSYFIPQPTSHMTGPPINPSGGLSEATADAEIQPTVTEEDTAPVSNFYCSHVPHVTEWAFGVRRPDTAQPYEGQVCDGTGTGGY